jgi:4-hydroxy-L-threonine phosphate dehydrogenase PdxA
MPAFFDIAGKNKADPQNMIAALKMCAAMAASGMGASRSGVE